MDADPVATANALLREKGYADRDLAVHQARAARRS